MMVAVMWIREDGAYIVPGENKTVTKSAKFYAKLGPDYSSYGIKTGSRCKYCLEASDVNVIYLDNSLNTKTFTYKRNLWTFKTNVDWSTSKQPPEDYCASCSNPGTADVFYVPEPMLMVEE